MLGRPTQLSVPLYGPELTSCLHDCHMPCGFARVPVGLTYIASFRHLSRAIVACFIGHLPASVSASLEDTARPVHLLHRLTNRNVPHIRRLKKVSLRITGARLGWSHAIRLHPKGSTAFRAPLTAPWPLSLPLSRVVRPRARRFSPTGLEPSRLKALRG